MHPGLKRKSFFAALPQKRLERKARLVAICFKAVQAGRGRSPALVAQNGLPPMQPGFFAAPPQKMRPNSDLKKTQKDSIHFRENRKNSIARVYIKDMGRRGEGE
jgi:hypothetical protein